MSKESISNTLIAVMLVVVVTLGFFGKPIEAGVVIVATSFAFFFLNPDKFSKVKGAGFEAELRESAKRADEATEKAYAALDDVKKLALALSAAALSGIAMSGQFSSTLTFAYKLQLTKDIEEILQQMNLSESEIVGATGNLYYMLIKEHKRRVLKEVRFANLHAFNEHQLSMNNLHFGDWDIDQLRKFVADHNLVATTDELSECWKDLEHFDKTSMLRRPEKYGGSDD